MTSLKNMLLFLFVVLLSTPSLGLAQQKTDTQNPEPDSIKKIGKRCRSRNFDHKDRIEAIDQLFSIVDKSADHKLKKQATLYLMAARLDRFNDYDDQYIADKVRLKPDPFLKLFGQLYQSDEKAERRFAVEIASCVGDLLPENLIDLAGKGLQSKNPADRWNALYALRFAGPKAAKFEDEIVKNLHGKDHQVRYAAVRTAGSLQDKAKKVVPHLKKFCTDKSTQLVVRSLALIAYGKVAAHNPSGKKAASEVLRSMLNEPQYMIKQRAIEGLTFLGDGASEGKDQYLKFMKKDRGGLAPYAAYCYAVSTKDFATACDTLNQRLKDPSDSGQCLIFLAKLKGDGQNSLQAVFDHAVADEDQISELHIMALDQIIEGIKKNKKPTNDQTALFQKCHALFQKLSEKNIEAVSHLCRTILARKKS